MPAATTDTILVQVPANGPTIEITRVFVTNTTGVAVTFRLVHALSAPYAIVPGSALYWDTALGGNATLQLGGSDESFGVHLNSGDALVFQASAVGVTVSVYGVTATVAPQRIRGV